MDRSGALSRRARRGRRRTPPLLAHVGNHGAPGWVGWALGWIIALLGLLPRGLDYLTGPPPAPSRPGVPRLLSVVEQYASTVVWGRWILTAGIVLIVTLLVRRIVVMLLGHLFVISVYAFYGLALLQGVLRAHDGWRFVSPVASSIALNLLCVYLLGRELRRLWQEDTPPRPARRPHPTS